MESDGCNPVFVTGAAGFIGSNFVRTWLRDVGSPVVSLDLLTYAGNLESLFEARDDPRHTFVHGDIGDLSLVADILKRHRPRAVINFVAESHVDRSILGPEPFVVTNVLGTFRLLEAVRAYCDTLADRDRASFRFLHVSTDEVFGELDKNDPSFNEHTPYSPRSPYAATKAASDHLVRAWGATYSLPYLITNCSNNFGPAQSPEKLIPLMILNAITDKPLPVYGDGQNIRDWIYVADHCSGLMRVLEAGAQGETYCIGGNSERSNLQVVYSICDILDRLRPAAGGSYRRLITFVSDRPGHDRRYSIDCTHIGQTLGWYPTTRFEEGLELTVRWYLDHAEWLEHIQTGEYQRWIGKNYGERLQK